MSKESSKLYTEECKRKYLDSAYYKTDKSIAVLGCAKNNIGMAIGDYLSDEHSDVSCFNVDGRDLNRRYFDWNNWDAFIFNNGYTNLDWIEDQTDLAIDAVMTNSLTCTMKTVRDIVNQTIDTQLIKTIVFIGSMAHNHVLNGSAPYCAAKAGLNMFAKCIAYELAPKGYRVYCINPSNVHNSPMTEATITGLMRYKNLSRFDAEAYWASECPMDSFLTKQEIAEIVSVCLTEQGRYLSGSPIDLTGSGR